MSRKQISGRIVDVVAGRIYTGILHFEEGIIKKIEPVNKVESQYILPGLVDAHVHIESSMCLPSAFGAAAACHGTLAAVCDPHEIANILGIEGIDYMIENASKSPVEFHFGAPSCVPASPFETSGSILDSGQVSLLLARPDIGYLSEMMNYPGVINGDPEVLRKIEAARRANKPIDGHSPGLRGDDLARYVAAGITTDHETLTLEEGREKIALGMKVILRSGSAADNLEELLPLLEESPEMCMFCTDDIHPDALKRGHIDRIIRKAIGAGFSPMNIIRAATLNPVRHYGLKLGLLQEGDPADFIVVDHLDSFRVIRSYRNGEMIAENGRYLLPIQTSQPINRFSAREIATEGLEIRSTSKRIRVIQAIDRQVYTGSDFEAVEADAPILPNPGRDMLKLVVLNRYVDAKPAVAFVRGFGLRQGAIASSIAHDSHNIIAVGADDASICRAVNAVIAHRGGICASNDDGIDILPLPVAGLMSTKGVDETAAKYLRLSEKAREMGSELSAPFMTLSFMGLTVIPELKLSDRGLFDGKSFSFRRLEA